MPKLMCCCYAIYADNQGMYAVGLTYTRVLQNKWMQEGKEHANNSIDYYFVGLEERSGYPRRPGQEATEKLRSRSTGSIPACVFYFQNSLDVRIF